MAQAIRAKTNVHVRTKYVGFNIWMNRQGTADLVPFRVLMRLSPSLKTT